MGLLARFSWAARAGSSLSHPRPKGAEILVLISETSARYHPSPVVPRELGRCLSDSYFACSSSSHCLPGQRHFDHR